MWTSLDRAEHAGWLAEQAAKCGRCSTFSWEWENSEGEYVRVWEGDHTTCHGCFELDKTADRLQKSKQPKAGRRIGLFRPRGD